MKDALPGNNYDILFLYNGVASPAMLELIFFAKQSGLRPLLVVLDRGEDQMVFDSSLLGYDVVRLQVKYKKVELKRFFTIPILYRRVKRIVNRELGATGIIVTTSLDMLFIARLVAMFRHYELRHQVRDLHSLQLGTGLLSSAVRLFERMLLRRVARIIVSSPRFATDYYEHLFAGEIVLLENVPQEVVWTGFQRRPRGDGIFIVGFVGVLRYKESLYELIETVERLSEEGMKIKVVFAGGSMAQDLADIRNKILQPELFEFSGSYEYAKDIKHLYQDLDLIYAVYDENNLNCQIAMPNKFYESILSKIPLLVAANTFVGEQTTKHGIGEVVSLTQTDNLYELLRSAPKPGSWYGKASTKLQEMSPDDLFAQYEKALAKSVL